MCVYIYIYIYIYTYISYHVYFGAGVGARALSLASRSSDPYCTAKRTNKQANKHNDQSRNTIDRQLINHKHNYIVLPAC